MVRIDINTLHAGAVKGRPTLLLLLPVSARHKGYSVKTKFLELLASLNTKYIHTFNRTTRPPPLQLTFISMNNVKNSER